MERFDVIQAGFPGDVVLARGGLVHHEALIPAKALSSIPNTRPIPYYDL